MRISKSTILDIAIIIFLSVSMNSDWSGNSVLWWGAFAILLMAFFLERESLTINYRSYSKWMTGFVILCVFSMFYALSPSVAFDAIKTMAVLLVSFTVINNRLVNDDSIIHILRLFFISCMINCAYLLLNMDRSLIGQVQIGADTNAGWNGNAIGMTMSMGFLAGLYLLEENDNKIQKLVIGLMSAIFVFVSLFTGSRKALLIIFLGVLIYFMVRAPRKILKNIVIVLILAVILYNAILKIEPLYNVIGWRMEGLFAAVTGTGTVDGSTLLRETYIENGIKFFKERPVLGYGINNYRILNQATTGIYTYSHNNFVEMLCGLGIVGFIYYYLPFVFIGLKMLKHITKSHLAAMLFAMFMAHLICHYGNVTYYDSIQNLLLCMTWCYLEKKYEV